MTEEEAIAKAIAQRNQLDDEINRLQNANKNIQPEEINAAAERKKVSDALGNIKKWKGMKTGIFQKNIIIMEKK